MGGCMDYLEFTQKNKPQGNALVGGIIVLLVSGMQIGWIFDNQIHKLPWSEGHSSLAVSIAFIMFYVSAIIGLFAASVTINRLTKSNIYFTALTFITPSSAMLIILPNNYYLVLISRMFSGFAHGYAYLTAIVHGSEIVNQKMRGMIISSLQLCIVCSAILTPTFSMTMVEESFEAFQWIGVVGIIYAAMGLVFTVFMTKESPVNLMREKKYDQAMNIMINVRNESTETWTIKNEFNELKTMVEEDMETSKSIFKDRNKRPLMLITLLKIAFVISFNYGVNIVRLKYTSFFITQEGYNFSVLVYLTIRLFTIIFTMFSIEYYGRKTHMVVSHAGSAALFMIFGVVVLVQPTNFSIGYEAIQIFIEILAGFGMGIISDVYSSEAFNTIKKARSIFFTTTVEFLLHIVIIFTTFNVSSTATFDGIFLTASGMLLCVITFYVYKQVPETAKMSIRQTRNEFLKQGENVFSGSNKTSPRGITIIYW